MTDRGKVIKGLEECLSASCRGFKPGAYCPVTNETWNHIRDALALLKAQEPVEPKWQKGYAYCGQCGYKLHWIVDLNNFCPNCGRPVKWND